MPGAALTAQLREPTEVYNSIRWINATITKIEAVETEARQEIEEAAQTQQAAAESHHEVRERGGTSTIILNAEAKTWAT